MDSNPALQRFRREWEAFLSSRGHSLRLPRELQCALESRDAAAGWYRWLLFLAHGRSKGLNQTDIADVKCHLRHAAKNRQKAYVVIRFSEPEHKVVVMPAENVLKRKRILPRKGGFPWRPV